MVVSMRRIGVARWPQSRRFGGGGGVVVEAAEVVGFVFTKDEEREREGESEKTLVGLACAED